MAKLVLSLSRGARIAATVTMIGGAIAIFGKMKGTHWAAVVGSVLLFGGMIAYCFERYRMFRSHARQRAEEQRDQD